LSFDRDDIDVRDEEERSLRAVALVARDEVATTGRALHEYHRQRSTKAARQRSQRVGLAAVACVDSNELVQNGARFVGEREGWSRGAGRRVRRRRGSTGGEQDEKC
jgi:hypothetical protein